MPPESNERDLEWQRLAADLRGYRAAQQSAWGGIDDLLIARYLAGVCSADETQLIEQAMLDRPDVHEAIATLREVVEAEGLVGPTAEQDAQADTASTLKQVSDLSEEIRKLHTGAEQLIAFDAQLIGSLGQAVADRDTVEPKAVTTKIAQHDPLYLVAAGEDDPAITTQPLWFTHVPAPPNRLWWKADPDRAEWNVRIWNPMAGEIHRETVHQSELQLAPELREALPRDADIRWEVRRAADAPAGKTYVRGLFRILSDDAVNQAEADRRELAAISDDYLRSMAVAGSYFEHRLFDDLATYLRDLHEQYFGGAVGYLVNRALASMFAAMQEELGGRRRMGLPEGLWANEFSRRYLQSAYEGLGISIQSD